jgi:hypothetical protein
VKLLRKLIAFFHLSQRIVCEESANRGPYDYHDYPDSVEGEAWHFYLLTCKRCGKKFYI